jgi:hypothetical protein
VRASLLLVVLLLGGCARLTGRSALLGPDTCARLCDRYFYPGGMARSDGESSCACWAPLAQGERRPRATSARITWALRR